MDFHRFILIWGEDGQILYDIDNYMKKKLLRIQEIIKEARLYRVKRNDYLWLGMEKTASSASHHPTHDPIAIANDQNYTHIA